MRFMNDYDMRIATQRYGGHPVLGPAIKTLENLVEWADSNSDGWSQWPKPARAANKLMGLIDGDGTHRYGDRRREDATPAAYRRALAPIKAFRTRHGADFEIIEV